MNKYFGMFENIKELNKDTIIECGMYDGVFSNMYTRLTIPKDTLDYYLENAMAVGKDVLEIACGDGGNYMIPLARKGFCCDGVDISVSMIDRFNEAKSKLPSKVRDRLNAWVGDIFEWEPEKKYDLITIPATTICLLADDEEKTKELLKRTYGWLKPGGRLMFDYRTDQVIGPESLSEMYGECSVKEHYMMLMQEYENIVPGRTVVNMYIEKVEDGSTQKYIASSDKKIITDEFIDAMMAETEYVMHNSYTFDWDVIKTRMNVYSKEEKIDETK
ncbi:class I SAM-dependent methyltransferase [Butyrivibrio sp. YAB3001]|uniref:class I SAM-dependent methyltransferase n=1 Tax=Butyrivibrio sp. YAB3001 TaxID=1520812 RepID=UPI0008F679DD|nr:class I SAM-dependent methyltransferase [Butyrivibrio sp. YAB3001]SFC02269.1 Methyltransferase domain-containing protein [Butyrivibrio sp. YAB3001]